MQANQNNTRIKSKSAIANSRVGIVDKETGEVIDEGSLIYVPRKVRITGFFMAMQDGLEYVAKSKLKGEALSVLMLLMSRMTYENEIRISQTEVGEVLSMKRQNVSRAIKALREAGVLDATENRSLFLSPDIGWKGKVQNLRKRQAEQLKSGMAPEIGNTA